MFSVGKKTERNSKPSCRRTCGEVLARSDFMAGNFEQRIDILGWKSVAGDQQFSGVPVCRKRKNEMFLFPES